MRIYYDIWADSFDIEWKILLSEGVTNGSLLSMSTSKLISCLRNTN